MRVLIAEDEPDICSTYKVALQSRNHEAVIAYDGDECIDIYKKEFLATQRNDHHSYSPFDAVVLDYRIPRKDGLQIAKEILELNPDQRIIFASAYVKETLEDSVKELKRVVELMQKPFDADIIVDTIEDKEAQDGVKILMRNLRDKIKHIRNDDGEDGDRSQHNGDRFEPSLDQLKDIFEGLRKIQKGRTF